MILVNTIGILFEIVYVISPLVPPDKSASNRHWKTLTTVQEFVVVDCDVAAACIP